MVLPVKLSIDDATHWVHTVDITTGGAQIGGLRAELQCGMTISLKRGSQKAKFRVAWIRQLEHELRVGVESLEPEKSFWGVDLSDPQSNAKEDMNALMTLISGSSNPRGSR